MLKIWNTRWKKKDDSVLYAFVAYVEYETIKHTQEQSMDESIDVYKEYKQLVAEYSDEYFEPTIVDRFCKTVYEDEEHFIFFKPFYNLYFSVYADALLWYQQGKIDYDEFCMQFQELSWMNGKRKPLSRSMLKMYIMSMREVVELYKRLKKYTLRV